MSPTPPDPWYIYLLMVNVGKYTSPMGPMGMVVFVWITNSLRILGCPEA